MQELSNRRILHIAGGSAYGGGSKVILDLATGSLNAGARVEVLTTNPKMTAEALALGVGVVDLDVIRRPIHPVHDVSGFFRLTRYLRRNRYDIVHTHTSKAGVIGRFAAAAARTPVVVHTVHGFAFHERSPRWQAFSVVAAERLASLVSSRVVTVSLHHYDEARRTGAVPKRKLTAVQNGVPKAEPVDVDRLAQARKDLLLPGKTVALLSHGRLATQKGLTYLLQGLYLMRNVESLPDNLTVSIVGDGELAGELRAEATELGLDDVVQFLGFRNDIHELIDAADIVVLPSLWEGLSIALMEAMSRGALVVVSDIPSNRELVQDGVNGILFASASASALASALEETLKRMNLLRPLGAVAQAQLSNQHGVQRMQDAYNRIYAEELGINRG